MTSSLSIGLGLTMLAGLMSGNCMLPMKFNRTWKWENTWLVFSVFSLLILPWALAFTLVDHLLATYAVLPVAQIILPLVLGFGWGIAQVLFGISVQRLGLGLAYAIIVGLGALLGTLVPLFVQHRSQVGGEALVEILFGVAVMLLGIALSTVGGQLRENAIRMDVLTPRSDRYIVAILLAILCGVMAPMLNFSFAFGQPIAQQAVLMGNSELRASYAVWPVGLLGGLLPNLGWSLLQLQRNRTWPLFSRSQADGLRGVLMAILWMGAFAIYGMSARYLGPLGTSVGWGLFQIFMILTAILSGVLTGEWKNTPISSRLLLFSGLICLVTATVLLAAGNH